MAKTAKVLKFEQRREERKARRRERPVDPVMNDLVTQIDLRRPNIKAISEKSGVAQATIRNWLKNKTRQPQNITMDFVAEAMGLSRGPFRPIEQPKHGRARRRT